jgi:hypothetical protein
MKAEAAAQNAVVLVEDECTTTKARIVSEASELLKRRDYRRLDLLAGRLRRDGQTFAQGDWPIAFFYAGVVELPKGSSDADWQARVGALREWFESDPDCITPRVALARGLVEYAWEARGRGWASSVTNDAWRLFGERITEARRILTAAETLGRMCPVYYSTRLRVALVDGTSREQYEQFFSESVDAFPTYPTFYFVKVNYLLPRWHGEPGEWEAFAANSADKVGGDEGDMLYAQIVWSLDEARLFSNIFDDTAADWRRVRRGFEALGQQYPNSISAPSEYCYLAGFMPEGGRSLTRELLMRLAGRVDLSVWKSMDRWTKDRAWAFNES